MQSSRQLRDDDLVALAVQGDAAALTALLRRHQPWIFNLAFYMLQARADAEDATQEVLLKLTTGLASFQRASAFRTWARRVCVNHLLDRRRSRAEAAVHGFECFAGYLERAADEDLAEGTPQERQLLVEEARRACSMGMLLCLDRGQRLTLLLGDILEIGEAAGAGVLGISRENFRQRLVRARAELTSFLRGRCGLVDPANPCRCARKTRAFIRDGVVDPLHLQFVEAHVARARAVAPERARRLKVLEERSSLELRELYPRFAAPDVASRIAALLGAPEQRELLEG